MTHVEHLREIIAAWTSADMDAVEAAIDRAVTHLDGEEPASETAEEPDTPRAVVWTGGDAGLDEAAGALVALYNAAKRLIDQGSSPSTLAELSAAVKAAERFVR